MENMKHDMPVHDHAMMGGMSEVRQLVKIE